MTLHQHQSAMGAATGFLAGACKGAYMYMSIFALVPFRAIGDSMILAAVGTLTGLLVTELWKKKEKVYKYIKSKFTKKNDRPKKKKA